MLGIKNQNLVKYATVLLILILIILAEPIFAKADGKAKGKSSNPPQRRSQPQSSSTARNASVSSRPVSRRSTVSSRPAAPARRPGVSRSVAPTQRSTRMSTQTFRNTGSSINRLSRQVQVRTPTSANVRTRSVIRRPNISVSRSTVTPRVSRPTVSSLRGNVRTQQRTSRNTNISVNRSIRISTSKSLSIGKSIGRPNISVANRSITTKTNRQKNIVSPNKTVQIGGNIGKSGTTVNQKINRSGKPSIKIQQTRTQIGSVIGQKREPIVKKPVGNVSRTKDGRGSVKKPSIGTVIGGEKKDIAGKGADYLRKSGDSGQSGNRNVVRGTGGNARREVVNKRENNDISRSKRVIQPGKRSDSDSVVKQPVIRGGGENRDPGQKSSLTRDKSSLQRLPRLEKDRQVNQRTEKSIRNKSGRERNSNEQLEQRRGRRQIVVKQLADRRGRRSGRIIYQDRPYGIRHINRNEHVYRDRYNNLCNRLIWPRYRFWVRYRWGRDWAFSYVYPYYHRKYVFVSLSGYWPIGYRYVRYYWYPWHVYRWYGYYPVARQIGGDSYNYYTYNYYNYYNDDSAGYYSTDIPPVDQSTFADVRAKLAQQAAEGPEQQTLADKYFEEAVKAFELGSYGYGADKFAEAMELAPDDVILPFAYVQAIFAVENYPEAAEALRKALEKVSPEKEGVFYPRGLYPDDDVLFEQIDKLSEKAKLYSYDADLQLLLGYQLLGIGETDEAEQQLLKASQDMTNAPYALRLLEVLAKIRQQEIEEAEVIEKEEHSDAGLRFFPIISFVGGLEKWKTVIWQNWLYVWFWRA